MSDRWTNAVGVLKAPTKAKLAALFPRSVTAVVDGWCATNPQQMREWEAEGTLFQRAQEVADQTDKATQMYENDRRNCSSLAALSQGEINEIYGGPSSRL